MTWVTYGGITLMDCQTLEWEYAPWTTEDGATQLGFRWRFLVRGYVTANTNNIKGINVDPETHWPQAYAYNAGILPAESVDWIKEMLSRPRQVVKYGVGTYTIQESPQKDPDGVRQPADSLDGPIPFGIQVKRIDGEASFLVQFGVVAHINYGTQTQRPLADGDFPATIGDDPAVLCCRWAQLSDVDPHTHLTTRTTTGYIEFDPGILRRYPTTNDRRYPASYMQSIGLSVPNGFRRGPVHTEAYPDGRKVAFIFTDTELNTPLGSLSPALVMQGQYAVHSGIGGEGAKGTLQTGAMLQIGLVGPKKYTRYALFQMACKLALAKVGGTQAFLLFTEATVAYDIDLNKVELTVKALLAPPANGQGAGQQNIKIDGLSFGLEPTKDYGSMNEAWVQYRDAAGGEQTQGSGWARMPELAAGGTQGSWMAYVWACGLQGQGHTPEHPGRIAFCPVETAKGPTNSQTLPPLSPGDTEAEVTFRETPDITIPYAGTGFQTASGTWISLDLRTKYQTPSGKGYMVSAGRVNESGAEVVTLPTTTATFDVSERSSIKVVQFTLSWVGAEMPPYPLPMTDDQYADPEHPGSYLSNDTFIDGYIQPAAPIPNCVGLKGWQVQGWYFFAQKKSRVIGGDNLAAGRIPNDPSVAVANYLDRYKATNTLLPGASPG